MNKVKYTREEYRNEYLKSKEWQDLRSLVMNSKPECQCCHKKQATDVHHLIYKNLVDITIKELLPVCRECHKFIHKAIDDDYISQDPKDLEEIKQKTIHILMDEEYENLRKWLSDYHNLSEEEIRIIEKDKTFFLIKRIRGLTKKQVDINNITEVKFSGKQILKIRDTIKTFLYRVKNKLNRGGKKLWRTKYKSWQNLS